MIVHEVWVGNIMTPVQICVHVSFLFYLVSADSRFPMFMSEYMKDAGA